MKTYQVLGIIILIKLLSVSCDKDLSVKEIKVTHKSVDGIYSSMIESYEVLPLDNQIDAYFDYFSKIIITDSLLLVSIASQRNIKVFDKSGKYIRSIGGAGRGPNEIVQLNDFTLNNDNSVTIFDRNIAKTYSLSGVLIQESKLDFRPAKSTKLKSGSLVFNKNLPSGSLTTDYSVILTDKDFNIVDARIPLEPVTGGALMYVGQSNRTQQSINKDYAYFFSYTCDTVYHIDDKSIYPKYYFTYDERILFSFEPDKSMIYQSPQQEYRDLNYFEIGNRNMLFFRYYKESYCLTFNPKTEESRLYNSAIKLDAVHDNKGIIITNSLQLDKIIGENLDGKREKCLNPETLEYLLNNKMNDFMVVIKIEFKDK